MKFFLKLAENLAIDVMNLEKNIYKKRWNGHKYYKNRKIAHIFLKYRRH